MKNKEIYIMVDNVKYISENDYLKVCEENDRLKTCLNNLQIQDENKFHELVKYEKELKDKDEMIERFEKKIKNREDAYDLLKEELNDRNDFIEKQTEINVNLAFENKEIKENNGVLLNFLEKKNKEIDYLNDRIRKADSRAESYENWYKNNVIEYERILKENERLKNENKEIKRDCEFVIKSNKFKAKEIERLKDLYEPKKKYEDWCTLNYECVLENGNVKCVTKELPLEEAHEIIGMNFDSWKFYSIYKYKKEVK